MKLRCLIVDDEPLALDILENYIQRLDNLELVGRCENAIEAYNILNSQKVDVLFLDIQMPQLTGIDFLKTIHTQTKIVLTTAYREYALESYELNVLDYLLKPISFDRFLKAVQKAIDHLSISPEVSNISTSPMPSNNATTTQVVVQNTISNPYQDAFIYLKEDKRNVRVWLKEILFIESLKDYVKVKTAQKEIITYQNISYLEEKLPQEIFIRVHRSFIIALDKVDAYSMAYIEIQNIKIPIGRNYKSETLKALERNNLLYQP
ncbi:MAG: DNA-binding response regulator [Cytophagales bacterium]|nr:MAG: DNA-binding response regulator [Cytophagales bacterium]